MAATAANAATGTDGAERAERSRARFRSRIEQRNLSDRAARILELCRGKRVLHLGCADDPFTETKLDDASLLHGLLDAVAAECYGVDQSARAVILLQEHGYRNLVLGRAEEVAAQGRFGDKPFDIVLAGEVLEHVSDAGSFLLGLRPLLQNGTSRLVLSTPSAHCAYRFVYTMLTGRERVHPDHVGYYSPGTLHQLLGRCGYTIEELSYYSGREYLRNRGLERILWLVDRIAFKLRPELGDGLIVVCRLMDGSDAGATGVEFPDPERLSAR